MDHPLSLRKFEVLGGEGADQTEKSEHRETKADRPVDSLMGSRHKSIQAGNKLDGTLGIFLSGLSGDQLQIEFLIRAGTLFCILRDLGVHIPEAVFHPFKLMPIRATEDDSSHLLFNH